MKEVNDRIGNMHDIVLYVQWSFNICEFIIYGSAFLWGLPRIGIYYMTKIWIFTG